MSESIPLRAGLGVEGQDVIVDAFGQHVMDSLLKRLPFETGDSGTNETPVGRYSNPVLDLSSCLPCVLGGEPVEHPQVVIVAEETPCIAWRPVFLQRQLFKGRCFERHFNHGVYREERPSGGVYLQLTLLPDLSGTATG